MALKPFNALDGLSVSENSIQIVFANGHVAAASLAVTVATVYLEPELSTPFTKNSTPVIPVTDNVAIV